MSDQTPQSEHVHVPGCCQRAPEAHEHPNWKAWVESARALMAQGHEETKIAMFIGEPVAVLKQ